MEQIERNNLFRGISKEVLDCVFETATGCNYMQENPELRPDQRRLDPSLAKLVITELPRLTKLEPGAWTVRKLLADALQGRTRPCQMDVPEELERYTEKQWERLLDLAEMYFFKTIADLDNDYDVLFIDAYTGWLSPDKEKLEALMDELCIGKDEIARRTEILDNLRYALEDGILCVVSLNENGLPMFEATEKGHEFLRICTTRCEYCPDSKEDKLV
jgi:hypothetical protein